MSFPAPTLPPSPLYSALAYYYDHQEKIEQRLRRVDQIQREKGPSPLAARLKAKGLLCRIEFLPL
jgi:hypothetical protein